MKLFFLGQLAVSYAGLADFFGDVSYQAEDAWLEEISKSAEERWHDNECQEYLLPTVPGGDWACKGNPPKKCALKCKNAPGIHGSVKCKGSTWKGAKNLKCPTIDPKCKCKDSAKPSVEHGYWKCFFNNDGIWVCDLHCTEDKTNGPAVTPTGQKVQIKCNHDNGKWWCNDVDPTCPKPGNHCKEDKLTKPPPPGYWNCDHKKGHCHLECPEGQQACLATCNRKTCQWEYGGEIKCNNPCNKHKKRECLESCGGKHPYCCDPEPDCWCKLDPNRDECIPKCDGCTKPGDGTGDFQCKTATIVGETKCTGKGKNQKCWKEPDQKRYVCQFHCQGKFTKKMIVCRDNKWFGNVSPEKFTCNPRCDGDTLAEPENGHWECTDKYFEHSRETVKDYNCVLKCKDGYEPKQDTQATCDIASGNYSHNCQAKCVKSCAAKNKVPCHNGKGCCCRPKGAPCDKQKKPKVDGGWWECMIDEHLKETCMLKCLNGVIPTNKHGYHVSIKCDKARWWANDPCIADLCKVDPVINTCNKSQLPNIEHGDWECTNGNKENSIAGTICTLDCDGGNKVNHAFECSPDGDWFKRYGNGKCECEPYCDSDEKCCEGDSPIKGHPKYNKKCEPCITNCPKGKCSMQDLPPIQGNGSWKCGEVKNGSGAIEYACVLMCGKNKTKQIMSCRAPPHGTCKWRGNVNGVCKCDDHCDKDDLMSVYHGKWTNCSVGDDFKNGIAYHTCNLECNGKVVTSCEATCSEGNGQKGNWKYSTNITKNHCSNVKKDSQDPCKDGCIKCNDLNVPSIPNGKWACKKKHCDLECNKGFKVRDGKCSLKCENHAWKVIGNPKCVPDGGPVDPPVEPCPKFIKVKNGWMECKQTGKEKAYCMLMCNQGHTPEYCDEASETFADYDCKTGYFNPRGPKGKKSKWGCVKGSCSRKIFGQTCWDDPRNNGMEKPNF